jgi:uncharacterized protein YcnI
MFSSLNPLRSLPIVAVALLATTGAAYGHVHAEDTGFKRNSKGTVMVYIEHGCGAENDTAAAVDHVVVLVPKGFAAAAPKRVNGWQASSKLTAEGHRVEWKRTVPRSTARQFRIAVRFPAKAGVYGLPTVQSCGASSIAWIEKAVGGEEPEHPLPTVTVN